MDLCQQCLYCSKVYFSIGSYVTHLRRDHKERILYVSAEQFPDDSSAIEHDTVLLSFVHEPHSDPFPHPSNNDSSDTEGDSENEWIDWEVPPDRIHINSTLHLANRLAGKSNTNKYFHIVDDEIDLWSPFSYKEEYELANWCLKHNWSRAAINEVLRNPTMATVSNFLSSNTLFERSNELSYAMGINSKTTAVEEQQIHNLVVFGRSLSLFFVLSMHLSIIESFCCFWTVECGNVILSSVHGRLITLKTFTSTQWSSPIALCAKHRNGHVANGIHCRGN